MSAECAPPSARAEAASGRPWRPVRRCRHQHVHQRISQFALRQHGGIGAVFQQVLAARLAVGTRQDRQLRIDAAKLVDDLPGFQRARDGEDRQAGLPGRTAASTGGST